MRVTITKICIGLSSDGSIYFFFKSNLIRYGVTNVVKISHHLSCCHILVHSRVCDSYGPQVFVDLMMIRIINEHISRCRLIT